MDQMLHSAEVVTSSFSSKMKLFDIFFDLLRINKGKRVEY